MIWALLLVILVLVLTRNATREPFIQTYKMDLLNVPRVYLIRNFLQPHECEALIKKCDNVETTMKNLFYKTCTFKPAENALIRNVEKYASEAMGVPEENIEPLELQIIRAKGFPQQLESDLTHVPFTNKRVQQSLIANERHYSFIVFLNDDVEGGELVFPNLEQPIQVKPEQGMAVMWNNCDTPFFVNGIADAGINRRWQCYPRETMYINSQPKLGAKYTLHIRTRFLPVR